MTAPEPTWHVAEDGEGDETLWCGDVAVLRKYELGPPWQHGADLLWQVLTRVLAPGEAVLMVLDHQIDSYARVLDDPEQVRFCTQDVLAALAVPGDPLAVLSGGPVPSDHEAEAAS